MSMTLIENYLFDEISLEQVRLALFVERHGLESKLVDALFPFYEIEQIKELIIIPGFFHRFEMYISPTYSCKTLGFIRDAVYYDLDPDMFNLCILNDKEIAKLRLDLNLRNMYEKIVGEQEDIEYNSNEYTDADETTNIDEIDFSSLDSLLDFLDGGMIKSDIEEMIETSFKEIVLSEEEHFLASSEYTYMHYINNSLLKNAILINKHDEPLIFNRINEEEYFNRFFNGNIRLVIHFAKRYIIFDDEINFPDLIQSGFQGVLNAMERFEPDFGYKFSTFAVFHIKQQMRRFLQNNSGNIRIPVHKIEEVLKLERIIEDYKLTNHSYPPNKYLLEETGQTEEELEEDLKLIQLTKGFEELNYFDCEYINQNYQYNPTSDYISEQVLAQEINRLFDTMLRERERFVLEQRFGLNETKQEHTLEEVGEMLGVTRERVRQIQVKVIKRFRSNTDFKELFKLYYRNRKE